MADWFNGLFDGARDIGNSFQGWMDGRDVKPDAPYSGEDLSLARQALLARLGSGIIASSMGGLTAPQRASAIMETGKALDGYQQALSAGTDRTRAGIEINRQREDDRAVAEQRAQLADYMRRNPPGTAPAAAPGGAETVTALPTLDPAIGGAVTAEGLGDIAGSRVIPGLSPRSVGAAPATPARPEINGLSEQPRWSYDALAEPQRGVADQVEALTGMPRQLFVGLWGRESSHRMGGVARGDGGAAAGPLQMHQGALTDINRTYGTRWTQVDLERDPNLAATVAGRYWKQQRDRFGDDVLATLSYNWGPGNVEKWRGTGGGWDRVPVAARQYVADVHGARNVPGLSAPVGDPVAQTSPYRGDPATTPASATPAATTSATASDPGTWWGQLGISPQAAQSILAQPRAIRERVIADLYEKRNTTRNAQIFGGDRTGYFRLGPDGRAIPLVAGEDNSRAVSEPVQKAEQFVVQQMAANPTIRDFSTRQQAFESMGTLARNATGQSDIGLVFGMFKVIDPTSTVREGEFAAAARTAGLPDRIVNALTRLDNGQFLQPAQRAELLRVAQSHYDRAAQAYGERLDHYSKMARGYGGDPSRIITDERHPDRVQDITKWAETAGISPSDIARMDAAALARLSVDHLNDAQAAAVEARIQQLRERS